MNVVKFAVTLGGAVMLVCAQGVSSTDESTVYVPHATYAATLAEQETELTSDPLIRRFEAQRRRFADDPYRPTYHFVSPESGMHDPNGLSYWKGRWHVFYQAYPVEYRPKPEDVGKPRPLWVPPYWGHAVSDDLVHWRDLPYAIYPGASGAASGSIWVDEDRAIAFYPDAGVGQRVAISDDPLLLNWRTFGPVDTAVGDSDIWREGDTYFGLIGGFSVMEKYYPEAQVPLESANSEWGKLVGQLYGLATWPKFRLWASKDLMTWKMQGDLLAGNTPFTDRYDDGSCPNFQKIGDKYILLNFSHKNGSQYLLGDFDNDTHKFRPYDYGRFNHGQVNPGGVHAPQAASDNENGVIAIFNFNEGVVNSEWGGIMSLPQNLTLEEDKRLRIVPVAALSSLRAKHMRINEKPIPTDREWVLNGIQGNAIEISLEIETGDARVIELNVLRSSEAQERTSISFFNRQPATQAFISGRVDEEVALDNSKSSIRADVWPRPPERAIVRRKGENLRLRVFVDRSVVEVFVNDRQYIATRVYPSRKDSLGVSLKAYGSPAKLRRLDVWQMNSIWPLGRYSDVQSRVAN